MTRDSVAGGLWGLLIGDALGVPYEFHPPEAIPPMPQIEMDPPAGFRRAHAGIRPGTWSDDGAQALCLLASLLECGKLDLDDLAARFVRWERDGYLAVDGRVFDIGVQTATALRLVGKRPAVECGGRGEYDNGNGSLMRVLPLALWHTGTDAELARDAMAQSRITHGHLRSQVACALYCLWARHELAGAGFADALRDLRPMLDAQGQEELLRLTQPHVPKGSGYVLDSLHSARSALALEAYDDVVRAAIAFGNDTDTTACIAGGIAGLRVGEFAIPTRWRDALRGRDLAQPLLDGLLEHRGL